MIETKTHWSPDTGYAAVILYDTKRDFSAFGSAQCCSEDMDMKSELTGLQIAQFRAEINLQQQYKLRAEIALKTLKDFEKAAKCCKHYQEDFQIENLLHKQVQAYSLQIASHTHLIETLKEELQEFLRAKEELYQKIRENRKQKNKKGE